jgi:hypothetical protein
MPCLGCCESDEERTGCISRCLGRRRRAQPPPPSSPGQAQRSRQSNREIEVTGLVASSLVTSQQAPQTGFVPRPSPTREAQPNSENSGVARLASPAALHLQRSQRTSHSGATRQQLALLTAAARGEERHHAIRTDETERAFPPGPAAHRGASLQATRGRSLEQQRVYSWPRRERNDQHASRSGPVQQQLDDPGVGRQTSTCRGQAQQRLTGARVGSPQRTGQAHHGSPLLASPPRRAPTADMRSPLVPETGSVTDQPGPVSDLVEARCTFRVLIDAHFLIAPKGDEHDRPTVEAFLRNLIECHNREVCRPHPAMAMSDRPGIPSGKAETWGVHMESLYPPNISAPRESSMGQTKPTKSIDEMY